jgi:hypothetical protein
MLIDVGRFTCLVISSLIGGSSWLKRGKYNKQHPKKRPAQVLELRTFQERGNSSRKKKINAQVDGDHTNLENATQTNKLKPARP